MGVELKPLGVVCNIQCHYCYEHPLRDAGNKAKRYDIEAMKAAVLRTGRPFSLFGGEPLLMPKADLEALWSWGLAQFGSNGIQTNGTLIDAQHVALFKAYKVSVGISLDGPAELNDARWSANLHRTRKATARSQAAIEMLCREGIPPGLIVTLHRGNAVAEKLPLLCQWFRDLERIGVRHARLHVLEVDSPTVREMYALTADECVDALLRLLALERGELKTLRFDIFSDMRAMLMGRDEKTCCVWNACDPLATQAVFGIEGNGQATNCSRTNKEGVEFARSESRGFERYLALYQTPQEHGGCKDCRFFLMCKGQCPGTAIDGDWRNRSESCQIWKRLYEHLEQELLGAGQMPISGRPERRALEEFFIRRWRDGRNSTLASALQMLPTQPQGSPAANADPDNAGIMPDFKRVAWVSDRARAVWEPRLRRIAAAWSQVEWLSVAAGLRACAVTTLSPGLFVERAKTWTSSGLAMLPLSIQGRGPAAVEAGSRTAVPANIESFRVAVATPENLARLSRALDHADHAVVAALLGVPACCNTHGRRAWSAGTAIDPVWSVAMRGASGECSDGSAEVDGPWQTNILWRWLGICALPHLPCEFDCEPSREIADCLLELGSEAGFAEEMSWMREILSWPVEWSALHGVAIVSTPILKLSVRTAVTDRKFSLRRSGRTYPTEGATALCFPYRQRKNRRSATSRPYTAEENAVVAKGA